MDILPHPSTNVRNTTIYRPIDRAVAALRRELDKRRYNPQYSREICLSAYAEHCLFDAYSAGLIADEDYEDLTETFAAAFDEVHSTSSQWADPTRWEAPIPTPEESLVYAQMVGTFDPVEAPLTIPPDVEPSAEDWEEWARWSASLDPSQPPDYLEAEAAEIGRRL